jgi:hypothetical protein
MAHLMKPCRDGDSMMIRDKWAEGEGLVADGLDHREAHVPAGIA